MRHVTPVYRVCLVLLFVPMLLSACTFGQGGQTTTSVAADVKAAQGATLTHPGGATLTIPPGALAGDAHVTLSDTGKASTPAGSALGYISDVFTIDTKGANGKRVFFAKPLATLSLKPATFDQTHTQDLLVATTDPDTPRTIHIMHSVDAADGDGLKLTTLTLKTVMLGTRTWIVRLPKMPDGVNLNMQTATSSIRASTNQANAAQGALAPQPTTTPYLHVPFYHQNMRPWCVPTSLSAFLNYYNLPFVQTGDPLNATLPHALANWEIAGVNHQSATDGAFYSELNALGIPEGSQEELQWDASFISDHPGPRSDFDSYVWYAAGTGAATSAQQHPLMFMAGLAWTDGWHHSLVIVGSDTNGLYLHDSNGFIGVYVTWGRLNYILSQDYQTMSYQGSESRASTNHWFSPPYTQTLALLGSPSVRPEDERQGSIAMTQEQYIDDADGQPALQLSWDGSNGHNHGYYWTYQYPGFVPQHNDSGDLGAPAGYGAILHYKYFIANVVDSDQTYTSTVTVSAPNLTDYVVSQTHTITVGPHGTIGGGGSVQAITGDIRLPPMGTQAVMVVRLFVNGSTTRTQDVKFLRIPLGGHALPEVTIRQPADGTHTRQGLSVELLAGPVLQSNGSAWANLNTLVWRANGTQFATGSTAVFPATSPGQYTIVLTGTDTFGYVNSDSITLYVDSATPTTPPVVHIQSPTNGASVAAGNVVSFIAQATQDGDLMPSSAVTWTFIGDGFTGGVVHTGSSFTYTFSSPGTIQVTAIATNSAGLRGQDLATIYIQPGSSGSPPTVSVDTSPKGGTDYYYPAGGTSASVTFLAAGSAGTYTWTDSVQGNIGSGTSITAHLIDTSSPSVCDTAHVVTVTVTDSQGRTAHASITVHVHACIP